MYTTTDANDGVYVLWYAKLMNFNGLVPHIEHGPMLLQHFQYMRSPFCPACITGDRSMNDLQYRYYFHFYRPANLVNLVSGAL